MSADRFIRLFNLNRITVDWWLVAVVLGASLVAIPLGVIVFSWHDPQVDVWVHLFQYRLADILRNTFVLVAGVGTLVTFLGVSLAWLNATCVYPGQKVFDWALMLPLAMPAYVIAFVFVGQLDYAGPVQTGLRAWLGEDVALPQVRSSGGIVIAMSLVLYPYVYMLARGAFLAQGRGMMEASRVCGYGPWMSFFKVSLPMARPAIAAGVALALMEALADFGAVSVFNYDTFTTAIYKAWYGFFNLQAAAQLASVLLLFALSALYVERRARGGGRYHATSTRKRAKKRTVLRGVTAWSATVYVSGVLLVAFVLPVGQLIYWVATTAYRDLDARYLGFLSHTMVLGLVAATGAVLIALVLAYAVRTHRLTWVRTMVHIATTGYALPGSVLAVGVMLSFVFVDRQARGVLGGLGVNADALLVGSIYALVLAYIVRFLTVAYGAVETGFERIKPSMPEAASILGATGRDIMWRIYLPMLVPSLLIAGLLTFVEVMKEMPATLLLRPFGWDTLAVRVYEMTSEGEWERAALPGLSLVLVGLLPVFILVRRSSR